MYAEIKELYKLIPKMVCKEGCSDCCGPIPYSRSELTSMGSPPVFGDDFTCQFHKNGKCEVYDKRPLMCRLFGVVDTPILKCPHGRKPNFQLSEEAANAITQKYIIIMKTEELANVDYKI